VTVEVPAGMLFVPFHFDDACANVLTNPALDPACKMPEYKVCAVRMEV
jgi:predicted molibdopterin-dependent oxidoreductase YjgC